MHVECRGNMITMPRRRRFKPRKDCEAILGKLSSYSSLYHCIYNPPQTPPFEKEGLVVSLSAYLTEGENYPNAILRRGHCLVVGEEILRCAQDDIIMVQL